MSSIEPIPPIQLYAKISDLIPTEGPIITRESFDNRWSNPEEAFRHAAMETRCPNVNAAEYYPQFLKDIKINGTTDYSILVHPNGIIGDGNFRRIWGIWANLGFLPINLAYFLEGNTAKWRTHNPYFGRGSAGKQQTIFQTERHLEPGFTNWWENEAREFLAHRIRWGPPAPEYNLSFKECLARLKQ